MENCASCEFGEKCNTYPLHIHCNVYDVSLTRTSLCKTYSTQPSKHIYTFEDYKKDLKWLYDEFKTYNMHIVAPYRGGLPLGVALSNKLEAPLSILDYQRYDGDSKEVKMIKDSNIELNQTILLVDDLVDGGVTIDKCYDYLQSKYPMNKVEVFTLFGRAEYRKIYKFLREHPGKWIHFEPWE